ncbi:glycosyltransferase family 2 protein [Desulfatiferula olefinivorans]
MEILFWIVLFILVYTYIGYFIVVIVLGTFLKKKIYKKEIVPSVTLIITAHNEENCIEKKIINCLELNYPKEKIIIMVASDCSTDNTNNIVRKYSNFGVKLYEQNQRLGKTSAQEGAIRQSDSEVIVFSDASTIYHKNAIIELVKILNDKSVGCVGGYVKFIDSDDDILLDKSKGVAFTDIEHLLRQYETNIFSTISVSGCIYAIKKDCYQKIDNRITDDFGVPLNMFMRGYRVAFEPNAIAYERKQDHEINKSRNIRTVNQGWVTVKLLNFFNMFSSNKKRISLILFMVGSHKILRWLSFIPLILLLITNIFVLIKNTNMFFYVFFIYQIVFYGLSLWSSFRKFNNEILNLPFKFCLYQYSAFLGFVKFVIGEKIVVWDSSNE